jgi:hypothetical protein
VQLIPVVDQAVKYGKLKAIHKLKAIQTTTYSRARPRPAADDAQRWITELGTGVGIDGRLVLVARCRARAPSAQLSHNRSGAMSLLISILITFVVIILLLYLVNLLPIDGRAKQIVRVIIIIIGILSLLRYLAVF